MENPNTSHSESGEGDPVLVEGRRIAREKMEEFNQLWAKATAYSDFDSDDSGAEGDEEMNQLMVGILDKKAAYEAYAEAVKDAEKQYISAVDKAEATLPAAVLQAMNNVGFNPDLLAKAEHDLYFGYKAYLNQAAKDYLDIVNQEVGNQ